MIPVKSQCAVGQVVRDVKTVSVWGGSEVVRVPATLRQLDSLTEICRTRGGHVVGISPDGNAYLTSKPAPGHCVMAENWRVQS